MLLRRLVTSCALALCLPLLAQAAPAPLTAVLVNFDDLGPNAIGANLPLGYAGFEWGSSLYYWNSVAEPGNDTLAMGSGDAIYFRRMDSAPFYFDGADFWSRRGLDATGDFYFVLYLQGQTVYNGLTDKKHGRMRFSGTPTPMKAAYKGQVDRVAIAFKGHALDWNHLAADNFRFRVTP